MLKRPPVASVRFWNICQSMLKGLIDELSYSNLLVSESQSRKHCEDRHLMQHLVSGAFVDSEMLQSHCGLFSVACLFPFEYG